MADRKQGTNIDQATIDRIGGTTFAVTDSPASQWFAPLSPIQTVSPKGSPTRAQDYTPGYNILLNPRQDEPITYGHMRFIAQNVPLVTMAIETRKDQMAKQKWDVRYTEDAVEGLTAEARAAKTKQDARIKKLRNFLRFPDKELSWDGWLRKLLDEVLVIDAPAVYMHKTVGGDPYRLMVLDGATITRKIALDGTTPAPNVSGVDKNGIPLNTAYQQMIKGMPYANYSTDELVFRPRNPRAYKYYGFSPVEQIIFMANLILRRDIFKLNYYTEGNTPPTLISVKSDWSADQIENFQRKFDATNQGDLAAMRRTQFIPEVQGVYPMKDGILKDEADEWFARIVMYAFSLPPTALTKAMNRATAEEAAETAKDEGLMPLMNWVQDFVNFIIFKMWGYDDLEFVWKDDKVVDPKSQAEIDKTYIDNGVWSRNVILKRQGLDPVDGGDVVTVSTSNGPIRLDEAVMSTEDKIASGMIADPTAPKVVAPPAKPGGEPTVSPEKLAALATSLLEFEDLNPELRDQKIVEKLAAIDA